MEHSRGDSRKFLKYTTEIERILIAYQSGYLGYGQRLCEKQFFGPLHAQASEILHGGHSHGILKPVRKMVDAQMAESCHRADIPGVHIASVELCNQSVYQRIVGLRFVLQLRKAVDQCQKSAQVCSGHILKSELVKLQLQDDFFKYLFQGRMDSDQGILNPEGGKKGGNVSSRKMNPVDLRILLCQIGVDLRLTRRIKDNAAGGNLFPYAVSQKMSAAMINIEQLVIRAAMGTVDREIFVEMILVAAADHKEGKESVFGEKVLSFRMGTGGNANHKISP